MRRIVAILLCFILGIATVPAFADTSEEITRSMQTLIAMGILDESAALRTKEPITRGEFIAAVMALCANPLSEADVPFTDFSEGSQYSEAIRSAYAMGFLNGYSDMTIREYGEITYSHAIRLLLCAAGYSGMLKEGVPIEKIALRSKICSGAEALSQNILTVEKAAEYIFDTGNSLIVEASAVSGDEVEYAFGNRSVFAHYLDIYRVEGVINANSYTYLQDDAFLDENRVRIGEEIYITDSEQVQNLLGCNVEAYYHCENSSDIRAIICAYPEKNEILTVDARNIIDYSGGTFSYYNEHQKTDAEKVSLSSVDVIYNNRLLKVPAGDDLKPENGSVTLIDNNYDRKWDVVVVEDYKTCVVDTSDFLEKKVYAKFGAGTIDLEKPERMSFTSTDGANVYAEELSEWDVLSVMESKDGLVLKAVFVPDCVEGVIETIEQDDDLYITVNSTSYRVSDSCVLNQGQEIEVGVKAIFCLDMQGNIAAIDFRVESQEEYGYLIAKDLGNGISKKAQIKLMDASGKVNIFQLAEKVVLDGTRYTVKKETAKFSALTPQLILYRVNADGHINYIDTAYVTKSDGTIENLQSEESSANSLCKIYDGYTSAEIPAVSESLRWKAGTYILGGKLAVSSGAKIFLIPNDLSKATEFDFNVEKAVAHFKNDQSYCVRAYKSSDTTLAADLLVIYSAVGQTTVATDTHASVISKIVNAYNADGDECYKISGFTGRTPFEYYTRNTSVIDDAKLSGNSYKPQRGDIVKFSFDINGKVIACEVIYSNTTSTLATTSGTSYYSTFRVQIANVYETLGGFFKSTTTQLVPGTTYTESSLANLELHRMSSYVVIHCNEEERTVSIVPANSIVGYINSGKTYASKVFIYSREGEGRMMVIYT